MIFTHAAPWWMKPIHSGLNFILRILARWCVSSTDVEESFLWESEDEEKKDWILCLKNNLVAESTQIILVYITDFVNCKNIKHRKIAAFLYKYSCIHEDCNLTEWICSQHPPKLKLQVSLSHLLAQISSPVHTASAAHQELRIKRERNETYIIYERNLVAMLGIVIKVYFTFGYIMLIPHFYSRNFRLHKCGPRTLFTPETFTHNTKKQGIKIIGYVNKGMKTTVPSRCVNRLKNCLSEPTALKHW